MKVGTKVRLTMNGMGASKRDELYTNTNESYGIGDEGVVAFPHPNKKHLSDWFYVEVNSKECPGEKRYIGCHPNHVEVIE